MDEQTPTNSGEEPKNDSSGRVDKHLAPTAMVNAEVMSPNQRFRPSPHGKRQQIKRWLWSIAWACFGCISPRMCHRWRSLVLRQFGAVVGRGAHAYPSCRIWAPWNLVLKEHSCLGDRVDCYSVDRIVIGEFAVVSQDVVLCTASHDHNSPEFPLITKPIEIGAHAWIAAGAFIGPGIVVGEGAVVGARAVVTKDVKPWVIVAGNPARVIGERRKYLEQEGPSTR
jgi:putative colanic acid biosynthesis acetyltransferase WcaF